MKISKNGIKSIKLNLIIFLLTLPKELLKIIKTELSNIYPKWQGYSISYLQKRLISINKNHPIQYKSNL